MSLLVLWIMKQNWKLLKIFTNLKEKKTLIIVTHKKELLKECDKIYKLENGKFLQNA